MLRMKIKPRHNEVIAFNEDLRETTIRDTEKEIQQLTNEVFSLHNKLENIHSMQTSSQHRLEELHLQTQQTLSSVEGVREQLNDFNGQLQANAAKLTDCLLYTSDAADERSSVDLGGRRIIKKKTNNKTNRKQKKHQRTM